MGLNEGLFLLHRYIFGLPTYTSRCKAGTCRRKLSKEPSTLTPCFPKDSKEICVRIEGEIRVVAQAVQLQL